MSAPQNPALVTIGVPTLGRDSVLLDTLKMLLDQDYEDFEVIVADQTSIRSPEFRENVKRLMGSNKRLRYYLVEPASLPAARNFIVKQAKGELVLFIDDDVKLEKDFVSRHAQAHQAHPDVAAVAGRIKQQGLPLSDSPLYFDNYGLPQGTFNCPKSGPATNWPGGNHSVKTEVIKKIGGYSTLYKKDAVREESEAAYRLVKAGYGIYYSAEAGLTHLSIGHGGSRIYKEQFDNLRFYINDLVFCFRTVKLKYLPVGLFRRLRIYSGGSGIFSLRRLKRSLLFLGGFLTALTKVALEHHNYSAKIVKEIR